MNEVGDVLSQNLPCIKKQFMSATPVKLINWQDGFLQELYSKESMLIQKEVLEETVNHPLMKKYPPKLSYRLAFLKDIIVKLEDNKIEVLDELYNTYCDLLNVPNTDSDTHFRHFLLDYSDTKHIVLEESSRLISHGTTGLCSWQAALALADWCLCKNSFFHGKHILEFGSGVGLTGLSISMFCEPSSYCFSDCHPTVLQMLKSNILLNVKRKTCSSGEISNNFAEEITQANSVVENAYSDIHQLDTGKLTSSQSGVYNNFQLLLRTKCNNTEISVLNLPWEKIPSSNILELLSPDILLAADVVYDLEIFEPLCQAICHFLLKRSCILFLACTIRNQETMDAFIDLLKAHTLEISEENLHAPSYFCYSTEVPIKIYRITAG